MSLDNNENEIGSTGVLMNRLRSTSPQFGSLLSECVTFSGKRKKGGNDKKKMITLNDNINDNTHPVQGKMITQK